MPTFGIMATTLMTYTMPTDIAGVMTEVTTVTDQVIPLNTVGLLAFFGFVVSGGVLLVRRVSKALR